LTEGVNVNIIKDLILLSKNNIKILYNKTLNKITEIEGPNDFKADEKINEM